MARGQSVSIRRSSTCPVDKMREGYYSDKYFVRARDLLRKDKHRPRVTMQVIRQIARLPGGIDEAIANPQVVRRAVGRAGRARAV